MTLEDVEAIRRFVLDISGHHLTWQEVMVGFVEELRQTAVTRGKVAGQQYWIYYSPNVNAPKEQYILDNLLFIYKDKDGSELTWDDPRNLS